MSVSLYASRREASAADYFLASRNLPWWLIGFSLVGANISTLHFLGMAGEGYATGFAVACFEWVAAITLVFVALVLLPRFLRAGIYTLPEYLEQRYGPGARTILAIILLIPYVGAGLGGVLYTGGLALHATLGLGLTQAVWVLGLLAGGYTIYGGLKAVVWSDLIQVIVLLGAGLVVLVLALQACGGLGAFLTANQERLHLMLPASHPSLPWTIHLGGIWVVNLAFWGLNQYIIQSALAARSLAEGQKGVLFAAAIKLVIPFLVVWPGIAAFQIYGEAVPAPDQAYPYLMTRVLPEGLRGLMFAGLFGSVLSTLDSTLNGASAIFTLDIYARHVAKRELAPGTVVRTGRIASAAFLLIACLLAPRLADLGGIFNVLQTWWSFIWPGILAVFLATIVLPRVPAASGALTLVVTPGIYGLLLLLLERYWGSQAYLNASAGAFLIVAGMIALHCRFAPRQQPPTLPGALAVDLAPNPANRRLAVSVLFATVLLYVYFW